MRIFKRTFVFYGIIHFVKNFSVGSLYLTVLIIKVQHRPKNSTAKKGGNNITLWPTKPVNGMLPAASKVKIKTVSVTITVNVFIISVRHYQHRLRSTDITTIIHPQSITKTTSPTHIFTARNLSFQYLKITVYATYYVCLFRILLYSIFVVSRFIRK